MYNANTPSNLFYVAPKKYPIPAPSTLPIPSPAYHDVNIVYSILYSKLMLRGHIFTIIILGRVIVDICEGICVKKKVYGYM